MMNIDTRPGALVTFAYPTHGYKHDQELAAKQLVVGHNYTVARTEIHNWHTDVYLEGFGDIRFNSVVFMDEFDAVLVDPNECNGNETPL